MRSNRANPVGFLLLLLVLAACGQGGPNGGGGAPGPSVPAMSGPNIMALTVNGSLCSQVSYFNKPCVSVTICAPGSTTNCQTVSDILMDTGSSGLRIFKSVLNSTLVSALTPVTVGTGNQLAECSQFGDGTGDWGPVEEASLILGGEPAVTVPIQVIDASYANASSNCSAQTLDTSPSEAGFNGILGVGLFAQDCGPACARVRHSGQYFQCNGSSCSGASPTTSQQVTNPVSALPVDYTGVIVYLPAVPLGGVSNASGYLILGIDTQSNNSASGVTAYGADPATGEMVTDYNGQQLAGIIDSGSNALFFPGGSLPQCGSPAAGFYCPSSTVSLSATTVGYPSSPSGNVIFQIGNFLNVTNSNNAVFLEVGGSGVSIFDFGLPFHFGKKVFVGLENQTTSLGTGPLWAY